MTQFDTFLTAAAAMKSQDVIRFAAKVSSANITNGPALREARAAIIARLRTDEGLRAAQMKITGALPVMRDERADVRSTVTAGLRFAGLALAAGEPTSPLVEPWTAYLED